MDPEQRARHPNHSPAGSKFRAVVDPALDHHRALAAAGVFGTGLGGAFERTESDLAVAVILECGHRGLPALPLHDAMLVPRSRAEEMAELMQLIARRAAGTELPVSISYCVIEEGEGLV